jgi:hypothetical protein
MELEELITLYNNSAWSEPDRARRQQILKRVWAEDGTYTGRSSKRRPSRDVSRDDREGDATPRVPSSRWFRF